MIRALAVVFAMLLAQPIAHAKDSRNNEHAAAEKPNPSNNPSPVVQPVTIIVGGNDEERAPANEAEREGDGVAKSISGAILAYVAKIFRDPVAMFTGLLWLTTIGLWLATVRLVKSGEATAKKQLRAYVGMAASQANALDLDHPQSPVPTFSVEIRNFGQTAALDVVHRCCMGIVEFPLTEEPKPPYDAHMTAPSKMVMWPGVPSIAHESFRELTQLEKWALKEGKVALIVHGEIKYKDIFGDTHTTIYLALKCAYTENLHDNSLAASNQYNYAD